MTLLTRALQAGHVEVVRELLARSTSVVCGLLTTDADSRIAQVNAVPTDKNQEAFAMVREATLRADTQLANMNTKSAPAPSSESGDTQHNLPPPEVARMIPCKFFPNCRYGDRCLFRHPQGPVMAESMPPAGQPVFFPGPFPPAPAPYGVPPPPFVEMFPVHYGPNGVPFFPQMMGVPPEVSKAGTPAPDAPVDAAPAAAAAAAASTPQLNTNSPAQPAAAPVASAEEPAPAARPRTAKKSAGKPQRIDAPRRANSGSRPSCAFFARSACRYANECRFPHVLPDGTDARSLPTGDKPGKPRRGDRPEDGSSSSGSSTPQPSKKGSIRRTPGASTRGKGARRGAAPTSAGRKTVQRVPNSDEFPALPGGTTDAPTPAPAADATKGKANFSAILSAPAPSKPVNKSEAPADKTPPKKAAAADEAQDSSAQQMSARESAARDFAAVVAAQPSAVTA